MPLDVPQLPELQVAVQSQVPLESVHEPLEVLPFTLPEQLPEVSPKLIPVSVTLPV